MPKKLIVSDEDKAWLRENHQDQTYEQMAARLGCCIDTIKRILVRMGLQDLAAAKYQTARNASVSYWKRPCIRCGSKRRRPRNWYMCGRCRRDIGYS